MPWAQHQTAHKMQNTPQPMSRPSAASESCCEVVGIQKFQRVVPEGQGGNGGMTSGAGLGRWGRRAY